MIYSDLNSINPTISPLLYDIGVIYQGLTNLFNTKPGELLFNPDFGIDLEDELFELITEETALSLYAVIFNAVSRWERRVEIDNASSTITPNPSSRSYDLIMYFKIKGIDEQTFQFVGSFTR